MRLETYHEVIVSVTCETSSDLECASKVLLDVEIFLRKDDLCMNGVLQRCQAAQQDGGQYTMVLRRSPVLNT